MSSDRPCRCVLVGEADVAHCSHLEVLLRGWGYQVEVCTEPATAIDRLQATGAPALALIDFRFFGSNPRQVVEGIRRKREVPVWLLAMGSDASADDILHATEAGVADFMAKPIQEPLQEIDLRVRLQTAERVQSMHGELLRAVEAVKYHSSHDALTGIWNREALLGMLFQETDRVQRMRTPLALIVLDLDRFTEHNVEYGYDAGDRILQQVAVRLRRYLRSYDLVGRSGEDEFLIGLPGCTMEEGLAMAERLRTHVLHRDFDLRTNSIPVRASFGVAESHGRSPLVVLREAERALADAKLGGRDCVRGLGHRLPPSALPRPEEPSPALLSPVNATPAATFNPSEPF